MKTRFLILTVLGVITTLIIYSCNITQGTISTINNTICSNYPDMNTMEVKLIHEMTRIYKANQLTAINNATSTTRFSATQNPSDGDSRAVWLDLETLKAFVFHIEAEAKKHPIPAQSKDLGVRIYYGSYPENTTWGNTYRDLPGTGNNVLTPNYEWRHSVVLIPTIRRNGIEVDFNPLDPDTYYSDGMSAARYLPGSSAQFLALPTIPSSGDTGAQNHGGLYPPLGMGNSGLSF